MAEKKTERKTTRYVVFRQGVGMPPEVDMTHWIFMGEFDAHGQEEAKRAAAEEGRQGTYAACPVSSWKPTAYGPRTVMVPLTGMEETGA